MSILVSGSLTHDYIMNFPDSFKNHIMPEKIHILNVCFMVDTLERSWGGTGGNIAYTIKKLGTNPILVSALGKDAGDYLAHLEKTGIKTDYIIKDTKRNTSSAHITTDADDNQVTAFYNGPLNNANEIKISDITEKPSLALISPTDKEVMIAHANQCRELEIDVVFDPGQQITAFDEMELKKMISLAKFVIGNDYEINLLQQKTGWDMEEILKHTEVVITTLGEKGSLIRTADGQEIMADPYPPQSYDDPTGAGDAYRAGFFTGFELGYNFKTCAQIGGVAASYAIETYGTQAHDFTVEEFLERYEKHYNEKISLTK